MKRLFLASVLLILAGSLKAQFHYNYDQNYNVQKAYWQHYYDSIIQLNPNVGDELEEFSDYNEFRRWTSFWDQYVPASGSFAEAKEALEANVKAKEQKYITEIVNTTPIKNTYLWTSVGPNRFSKIKTNVGGNWINPHVNNMGNIESAASVGKFDQIFLHPNDENIVYVVSGGADHGGGGLFVSFDAGNSWQICNTDLLANPVINSIEIKPIDKQPNIGIEYIYIGFGSGAVYRAEYTYNSSPSEVLPASYQWKLASYNGTVKIPTFTQYDISNISESLPFNSYIDFKSINYDLLSKLQYAPISTFGGGYERLICLRRDGIYHSENHDGPISLGTNQVVSSVQWGKFDLANIESEITSIMDAAYSIGTGELIISYNDFEYSNGLQLNYYASAQAIIDRGGGVTSPVRQFVMFSNDGGNTWSFLGGVNSNQTQFSSANNLEVHNNRLTGSNLELMKNNPNFIYLATTKYGAPNSGYSLRRYDLNYDEWCDFDVSSGFYTGTLTSNGINAVPSGFTIDPQDDTKWWYYTNEAQNSVSCISYDCSLGGGQCPVNALISSVSDYSKHFHADVRDVQILSSGDILIATDGGIYKSTTGINFNSISEGLNAAQSDRVIVTQKPPFIVGSGFWHSGVQLYNPELNEWHWCAVGDGNDGRTLFLNNNVFSFTKLSQTYVNTNDFNNLYFYSVGINIQGIVGSENLYGRVYVIRNHGGLNGGQYGLEFNNSDDVTSTFSIQNTFCDRFAEPYVIPNDPDKVVVADKVNEIIHIYDNMTLPLVGGAANIYRDIDCHALYNEQFSTGDYRSNLGKIVFDPRKNGIMYFVLNGGPVYDAAYTEMRVVKYDMGTGNYVDLSDANYLFEASTGTQRFPNWVGITGLEMDRQTGILYLSTTTGVFYLDETNKTWRSYSDNLPYFNTKLGIVHCKGEIYASSNKRGIWKADLLREPGSTLSWDITQNETWTQRMNLFCTLTVKSGHTLTIKNELMVYGNQKIVVEPGARLIIDGGTISTECGDFWQGILVEGNSSMIQNILNQGVVEMKNGGTIEYAYEGIRTIGLDSHGNYDWSKTGGIIYTNNAKFLNCRRSMEILSYHSFSPSGGAEVKNMISINNTQFLQTGPLPGGTIPYAAVTLYDVNGVKIRNSVFSNTRTDLSTVPIEERGSGIYSIESSYNVVSRYNGQTGAPLANTGNQFTNLYYGVLTSGGTSRSDVVVDDNSFSNCAYGVALNGSNYGEIARNTIAVNGSVPANLGGFGFGIYANGSWGFVIESNTINSIQGSQVINQGIHINNSGDVAAAKVRLNGIDDILVGTQTTNRNLNTIIDCNIFNKNTNSGLDLNIYNGVLADQGYNILPNYNQFTNSGYYCNNGHKAEVYNSSGSSFIYTARNASNHVDLNCHNLGTDMNLINGSNDCPISPEVDWTNTFSPTIGFVGSLSTELTAIKTNISAAKAQLASGDADALITTINSQPLGIVKNALMNASPYLSDRVLLAYLNLTNVPPPGHVKDVVLANSPVTETVKTAVDALNLPRGIQNQINAAQTGISARKQLEIEIEVLNIDRLAKIDAIVRTYLDTNWMDSAISILEAEGSLDAICALVPIYVKKDTVVARQYINQVKLAGTDFMHHQETVAKGKNLLDFCVFHQTLMKAYHRTGGYFSLDSTELDQLAIIAATNSSVAVNAQAVLDFVNEKFPILRGYEPYFPHSMTVLEAEQLTASSKEQTLFTMSPNPSTGKVTLRLGDEREYEAGEYKYIITDLQGKIVKTLPVSNSMVVVEFIKEQQGIYLVHLLHKGQRVQTQKLVLIE